MRPDRKAAREAVGKIKTREDLRNYLDLLNLTDEEREIAWMIFAHGWSRAKIAMEIGYSEHQVKRKVARIYDKLVY